LIVRENLQYARRQLMWFRKEPGVRWLPGPGTDARVQSAALELVRAFLA
jgi:tRNA dimethylallyltransferase